jgi:hypothetical protein
MPLITVYGYKRKSVIMRVRKKVPDTGKTATGSWRGNREGGVKKGSQTLVKWAAGSWQLAWELRRWCEKMAPDTGKTAAGSWRGN